MGGRAVDSRVVDRHAAPGLNVAVHNEGMPLTRPTPLRRLALAVAAGLVLASCGGSAEEPTADPAPTTSPSPSSTVAVPESVELTEVGADLAFGDSATVIHEPNQKRGTVLELTVTSAEQGTTKDLSGFILDDYTRAATLYYVQVEVENVGEGDVGGAAVPLWGVDGENTLLPPATFTTTFRRCPSAPLPREFEPEAAFRTCLVFLAPDGGVMQGVSFRPNQEFDPIRWTGEISTPAPDPKKTKKTNKTKKRGND